jgi:hypothetical protein
MMMGRLQNKSLTYCVMYIVGSCAIVVAIGLAIGFTKAWLWLHPFEVGVMCSGLAILGLNRCLKNNNYRGTVAPIILFIIGAVTIFFSLVELPKPRPQFDPSGWRPMPKEECIRVGLCDKAGNAIPPQTDLDREMAKLFQTFEELCSGKINNPAAYRDLCQRRKP